MSIIHRGTEEGRPPGSPSASGICGVALQGTGIWAAGTGCGLGRVQRRTGGRQRTPGSNSSVQKTPLDRDRRGWTGQNKDIQSRRGIPCTELGQGSSRCSLEHFWGKSLLGRSLGLFLRSCHTEKPQAVAQREECSFPFYLEKLFHSLFPRESKSPETDSSSRGRGEIFEP